MEPENDPANYNWGFYYNKQDSRIIVPKGVIGYGWNFNFAHLLSYMIIGAIVVAMVIYGIIKR
jgi:uncharacterized membrane protein